MTVGFNAHLSFFYNINQHYANYKQHYTKFFKNIVDKNVQLRYNYQKDYRYNCTLVRINKKHTGLLALCGRNLFAL